MGCDSEDGTITSPILDPYLCNSILEEVLGIYGLSVTSMTICSPDGEGIIQDNSCLVVTTWFENAHKLYHISSFLNLFALI